MSSCNSAVAYSPHSEKACCRFPFFTLCLMSVYLCARVGKGACLCRGKQWWRLTRVVIFEVVKHFLFEKKKKKTLTTDTSESKDSYDEVVTEAHVMRGGVFMLGEALVEVCG